MSSTSYGLFISATAFARHALRGDQPEYQWAYIAQAQCDVMALAARGQSGRPEVQQVAAQVRQALALLDEREQRIAWVVERCHWGSGEGIINAEIIHLGERGSRAHVWWDNGDWAIVSMPANGGWSYDYYYEANAR